MINCKTFINKFFLFSLILIIIVGIGFMINDMVIFTHQRTSLCYLNDINVTNYTCCRAINCKCRATNYTCCRGWACEGSGRNYCMNLYCESFGNDTCYNNCETCYIYYITVDVMNNNITSTIIIHCNYKDYKCHENNDKLNVNDTIKCYFDNRKKNIIYLNQKKPDPLFWIGTSFLSIGLIGIITYIIYVVSKMSFPFI